MGLEPPGGGSVGRRKERGPSAVPLRANDSRSTEGRAYGAEGKGTLSLIMRWGLILRGTGSQTGTQVLHLIHGIKRAERLLVARNLNIALLSCPGLPHSQRPGPAKDDNSSPELG